MARRKRRTRRPHPGVKLHHGKLADGWSFWRARFVDPDTGREGEATLDPVVFTTNEARTAAPRPALQLGNSLVLAERHFVDLLRGIPRDAHTLEPAMAIEGPRRALASTCAAMRAVRRSA